MIASDRTKSLFVPALVCGRKSWPSCCSHITVVRGSQDVMPCDAVDAAVLDALRMPCDVR